MSWNILRFTKFNIAQYFYMLIGALTCFGLSNWPSSGRSYVSCTVALKICNIQILRIIVSHEIHSKPIVTIWWKILFPWKLSHTGDLRLIASEQLKRSGVFSGRLSLATVMKDLVPPLSDSSEWLPLPDTERNRLAWQYRNKGTSQEIR